MHAWRSVAAHQPLKSLGKGALSSGPVFMLLCAKSLGKGGLSSGPVFMLLGAHFFSGEEEDQKSSQIRFETHRNASVFY